jgi:predicted MFS family arabinose efflux permease
MPEEERARANGVMWGGKILGTVAASVVNGAVIARFDFAETALVTAVFVAAVMLVPLLVRERPGERLTPCSAGEASAQVALFMAVLNLGTSFGAQRFGTIQQAHGFEGAFAAAGAAALLAPIVFFAARDRAGRG